MQGRTRVRAIVLSLLLGLGSVCNSQAYKYHFRTITLPEEFKNQYISLVDEDGAGMLWFVTNSGLHRYDGNQVLTFDMQSTPALPSEDIGQLVASKNLLWLAIRDKLVRFDLQQWSMQIIPFQHDSPTLHRKPLGYLAEGKDGTLYAAGGSTLYRVVNDSLEFITDIDKQTTNAPNNGFDINAINEPEPGHLLLLTFNRKILSLKHRQAIFDKPVEVTLQQGVSASLRSLTANRSGNYFFNVPGKGLYKVDLDHQVATSVPSLAGTSLSQSSAVTISELGGNQAIFFYTKNETQEVGLVIYNPKQNTFEDLSKVYPIAIKNNKLRPMGYRNGHILIPNKGGIATVSYTSSAFDVFNASLENVNSIRTIYKKPDGPLLINSYLYQFYQFDEASSTRTPRSSNLVECLVPWSKDSLLVGEGGLKWYLPPTNRFVTIFDFSDTLVNSFLNCLTRETDTSVWLGTYGGFYLINPYTRRILQRSGPGGAQPSRESMVFAILKVGQSRFFATREGLFKYNLLKKSWTKLLTAPSGNYADANFTCLQLANNQIWAGTVGNGMLVLDTAGNLTRKMTTADGLAGNTVFSNPVFNDHLLVGTRTGLSIIDLRSGKISNYSSEYYLPADEFNRSAWYINGDTAYLGTLNGFIRITMDRLQQQQATTTPGISFSSFTFSNGRTGGADYTLPYRSQLSLTIPPDVSNFSLAFGGFSEVAEGLQLFYRLKANEPWQAIGKRREITFVNIAPDKYAMQMAARLPDGRWRENLLTLPIIVEPHFYQTWWWKAFVLSVAIGLIWLSIKYRERGLRKEQQLRSRIAGDLHDEVGSALTRIYFQAGMLTTKGGTAAAPSTDALEHIAASSREALSSMSDMVWSIDAHHDNAADMVDRIRDYIARLQDELDCHCTFSVSGSYEGLRLSQVLRQNILLIFKEAVNNAIKYGSNKTVAVHLSLNENELLLKVGNKLPDNGIADNTVQGGHGMKSMQLRADKIKAKLTVTHTDDEFIVQLQAKPL